MALIAILLALLVERHLGSLEELRRFGWFDRFTDRLREVLPSRAPWDGPLGVVVAVGAPALLITLADALLTGLWLPLGFVFAILVLLYCLGPRDLEAEVEAYLEASRRGDRELACWYAAGLLGREPPQDPRDCGGALTQAVLVGAHERVLGVVFWFLLLGPAGALLYRLSGGLSARQGGEESDFADAADRLHAILGWLPVRLTAVTYALAGSFVLAMHRWREEADRWRDHNRGILVSAGLGALGRTPAQSIEGDAVDGVREGLSLAKRAVIIWLTVIAVLTLAGWVG